MYQIFILNNIFSKDKSKDLKHLKFYIFVKLFGHNEFNTLASLALSVYICVSFVFFK